MEYGQHHIPRVKRLNLALEELRRMGNIIIYYSRNNREPLEVIRVKKG